MAYTIWVGLNFMRNSSSNRRYRSGNILTENKIVFMVRIQSRNNPGMRRNYRQKRPVISLCFKSFCGGSFVRCSVPTFYSQGRKVRINIKFFFPRKNNIVVKFAILIWLKVTCAINGNFGLMPNIDRPYNCTSQNPPLPQ